ncbi:trichohyalin-like isoform X8 [Branchiostoma floridae]|uniref:Trichohyalin-like isoform X8 n=1 Tax=Branchiostoma floridae TaxID=7739 RepID=A0A9J7N531_BRAFL|nr:trichohyalin-like isoform X8 [Branchiostoma floridae]
MEYFRKIRGSSSDAKSTQMCVKSDKFMSIDDAKSEIVKMKETNYQLKNSVLILTRSTEEMKREAVKQQSTISLLKKTHMDILVKKDEELANQRIAVTAQKVAQEALTKALNIIIKEQQDTASLTEELLLETRSDLTSSKAEAAKLREELKTLRAELLMRENDMCQMEELYEKQKRSLQQIHRKEVQALTEGFEQEMQERNKRERFLQEMIIKKNTEIKEVKKEMATMKDIYEEELKALKESFLQVIKDRDDKERLLQQTILLKNEEVAALRRNMKAEKDIHEEEVKELQQTIRLDSLFVKDLMAASSKIESEELERVRKDKETLEYEHNLTRARLEESETKLKSLEKDGERLLSELNSMKSTLLKSWVDRNNEVKIMQDRLFSMKAEREIFKVLATASKRKQEEEERHSNEHIQRVRRQNHREQVAYLHQAWQDAARSPRHVYDPNWPPENSINRTENVSCFDKDTDHVRDKT